MRFPRQLGPGAVAAVLFAFLPASAQSAPQPGVLPRSPAAGTEHGQAPAAGRSVLPAMTLSQLAGQRVIYSYTGLRPPARLKNLIRAGEVGGVVFFADNIRNASQLRGVIANLQRLNASSPAHEPLLMMTDQEGGAVRRLPGAPVLSQKQIGASAHPEAEATRAGRGAGRNLRGAGLNVNLAPVLDVYRKAGNFIDQYGRSYSRKPAVVAKLGSNFIRAQQAAGVAATAKHFPGLGAASRSQNTDLRPVTLRLPKSQIRSVDEYPYHAAISAGARLVMVSWARYPAFSTRPAGLSTAIVQGELRRRLGFAGVTITDSITAGALRHYGSFAHRGVMAAHADMDLLLFAGQNPDQGARGVHALVAALRDGTLKKSAFEASVRRIIALRKTLAG